LRGVSAELPLGGLACITRRLKKAPTRAKGERGSPQHCAAHRPQVLILALLVILPHLLGGEEIRCNSVGFSSMQWHVAVRPKIPAVHGPSRCPAAKSCHSCGFPRQAVGGEIDNFLSAHKKHRGAKLHVSSLDLAVALDVLWTLASPYGAAPPPI